MKTPSVMNKYFLVLLIILGGVSSAMTVTALDQVETWNLYREGEAAFRQANELLKTDPTKARDLFEKAALCFEAILRDGGIENGRILYNIGNIYFRLGNTGKAILNYRRAERFIPNDLNLHQNLNYARSRCVDKIESKPQSQVFRTVFFWHYDLSGPTRSWLFAVVFSLLWLFACLYLWQEKSWLRYAMICCGMLSVLFGGSLAVEAYEQSSVRSGVILATEVVGRKGDSTSFEPTFKDPLHMGVEFNLVEERKGWLLIELADGRRSWIPESAAGIIQQDD
jgi:tetratricopeptide (TPR) repeat protein